MERTMERTMKRTSERMHEIGWKISNCSISDDIWPIQLLNDAPTDHELQRELAWILASTELWVPVPWRNKKSLEKGEKRYGYDLLKYICIYIYIIHTNICISMYMYIYIYVYTYTYYLCISLSIHTSYSSLTYYAYWSVGSSPSPSKEEKTCKKKNSTHPSYPFKSPNLHEISVHFKHPSNIKASHLHLRNLRLHFSVCSHRI